jgi:DNA-binding MarR family transcriptional regulator
MHYLYMDGIHKVIATTEAEKRILNAQSRLEVSIVLELYRVHPSPLMVKSLASVCDTSVTSLKGHLKRLVSMGMLEQKKGFDARARFYCLSRTGESKARAFVRLYEDQR